MSMLTRKWAMTLAGALTLALLADAAAAQTSASGARAPAAPPRAAASPQPTQPPGTSPGDPGGGSRSRAPAATLPPSAGPSPGLPAAGQVPQVAPLSPQLPTQFSTDGRSRSNLALSPGASSGSASQSTPSRPGGGGETLADCMSFWEPATHMTKAEWKAACRRTLDRIANP